MSLSEERHLAGGGNNTSLQEMDSWKSGTASRRTAAENATEAHRPQGTARGRGPGQTAVCVDESGRPSRQLRRPHQAWLCPRPTEEDTYLEPQGLQGNKKHLRAGKGTAAGAMLIASPGTKVKCEPGGVE